MTEKSIICRFIRDHPDDWDTLLKQKGITIKTDGVLSIFKYGIDVDFNDPLVCEARGIIINTETNEVVCWPFKKFFNVQESYAARINWQTAHVQDKIDGSLIKVWYNWNKDKWQVSTMSTIDACDAETTTGSSFLDLFHSAENYKNIIWDVMDKYYTYLFELVSPENQVVIRYPVTKLYHIGTIKNTSGEEVYQDIGIQHPIEYWLKTLDDCMYAVKKLNEQNDVKKEGFVVVDSHFNRIKIKSPEYLALHRTVNNHNLSMSRILNIIIQHPSDISLFCGTFPFYERVVKYYQWQLSELHYNIKYIIDYTRRLYDEYDGDRAAVAEQIKGNRYSYFGFRAIGNNKTSNDLLNELNTTQLSKYIKEYKYETQRFKEFSTQQ